MADINVTADFRDLESLKQILGELAPLYGRVVARIERETKQLERATETSMDNIATAMMEVFGAKAQADMAKWGAEQRRRLSLMQESEKIAKAQAAAEAKLTAELEKQALAQAKAKAETAFALGAQRAKEEAAAVEQLNAAKAAQAAREDFLKSKYDSTYAAMKLYKSEIAMLNEALESGAISHKMYSANVEALSTAFKTGSGAFAQFNGYMNQSRGYTNQWGVVTQQAGYQIGDFLVQVQSGTNWMVAFGQQATQLVGVLPLMTGAFGLSTGALIALSTGLGIAIPLVTAIGAAWMRTRDSTDEASEATSDFDNRLKALDKTLRDWLVTQEAVQKGVSVEELISNESLEEANIQLAEAKANLEGLLDVMNTGIVGGGAFGAGLASAISQLTDEQQAALAEYQAAVERVSTLRNKIFVEGAKATADEAAMWKEKLYIEQLIAKYGEDSAMVFSEQLRIQTEQYRAELAKKGVVGAVADALVDQLRQYERIKRAAELAADSTWDIKKAIDSIQSKSISIKVNFQAAFSNFTGAAASWAEDTWTRMQDIAGVADRMDSSPRPQHAEDSRNAIDGGLGDSGGGGGGGGGGDNKLESLINSLKTEKEVLDAWYKESETALQSASDKELAVLGGKHEAMLRLEQEYQEKSRALKEIGNEFTLTGAANLFGELYTLSGSQYDRLLKLQKVFTASQALIDTWGAYAKALKDGGLTPWQRFAWAAKVLAAGMGAVNAIKGVSMGGGSSGGGVGSSTVSSATSQPSPQTVYIDSIQPDALYSGQTLINLFDAFYNENDKRGKVFVVARG